MLKRRKRREKEERQPHACQTREEKKRGSKACAIDFEDVNAGRERAKEDRKQPNR